MDEQPRVEEPNAKLRASLHEDLQKNFLKIAEENPNNADMTEAEKEKMRAGIKEDVSALLGI